MKQLRKIELKRFKKQIPQHDLDLVLILENIQYASNVAGIFRTADAVKVREIMLTGISQQPPFGKKLQKTSRLKEKSVRWSHHDTAAEAIAHAKQLGYRVVALEITDTAQEVKAFMRSLKTPKIAIVIGNEAQGVSKKALAAVDEAVYLPMFGKGASLNVAVACAVFLYTLVLN